ncbi:MAG: hypothetical protein KDF60_09125 [Calditrichaeota bacterium]|nr:hypothetical protein [Calditrichota bacterium]
MKNIFSIMIITALFLGSCSENGPTSSKEFVPNGSYNWDYSVGGLWYHVISPATEGYTQSIVFSGGNKVSIYNADTLFFTSRYTLQGDTLFYENNHTPQIFKLSDGKLTLTDLCVDCFEHYYSSPDNVNNLIIYDHWRDLFLPDDPLDIKNVSISKDILSIDVQFGGGCEDHLFDMFTASAFLESNPVQADLKLVHNGLDDPCDALISKTVKFDLTPLKKAYITSYGNSGSIYLRISISGDSTVYTPMPLYTF